MSEYSFRIESATPSDVEALDAILKEARRRRDETLGVIFQRISGERATCTAVAVYPKFTDETPAIRYHFACFAEIPDTATRAKFESDVGAWRGVSWYMPGPGGPVLLNGSK